MNINNERAQVFKLDSPFTKPWSNELYKHFKQPLEYLTGLTALGKIYESIPESSSWEEFVENTLSAFRVRYEVSDEDLARIAPDGPLIVVANHPFGGLEGMILASVLRQVRSDVKILANFLLSRIPELRKLFFFVDPFGSSNSQLRNIGPLRDSVKWVNQGQALGMFPSGTVSHFQWPRREVSDPVWSNTVARIIRRTEAPVIPLFFDGANGLLFQILGLIHPLLRTAMLPRELLNRQESTVRLRVGLPVPREKLQSFNSDEEMLSYLRLRTYILGDKSKRKAKTIHSHNARWGLSRANEQEIAPAVDAQILEEQIANLPEKQLLLESNEYQVYYASAYQIRDVLKEIGRLREIAFRSAGEGTGKSLDLDEFDRFYTHLFVWNKAKHELVGGYRLGKTDALQRRFGIDGLYTSTLFSYKAELLNEIGPALELGRSFVRLEYQRNYSPLLLLWKGIGRYVVKNPDYKTLFGTVSISNDYASISRQLIIAFLKQSNYLAHLAKLIKPKNPPKLHRVSGWDPKAHSKSVTELEDVTTLIKEIEENQRGIPVLLRQYLRLGGKLIGFNIDPDFGNCVDGLILVDMAQCERRLLDRYFGKDGAESFLRHHRSGNIKKLRA